MLRPSIIHNIINYNNNNHSRKTCETMIRKYRKGEKKKPEGIIFKKASEVRVKKLWHNQFLFENGMRIEKC